MAKSFFLESMVKELMALMVELLSLVTVDLTEIPLDLTKPLSANYYSHPFPALRVQLIRFLLLIV